MMKKLIALSLLLAALGSMAFADTAEVLPAMVGRVYLIPSFTHMPGGWDHKGNYSRGNTIDVFNLGLAVEFGILDWLSAAIQWAPGWTPWSDVGGGTVNTNGLADMFVGAKALILGEKAPVENDMFRFAVSLGILVPLPGPDFTKELTNAVAGKDATLASMDKHVFAFGGRLDFDWLITENFTLNLHNETRIYPIKQDFKHAGPELAGATTTFGNGKVNYKYQLSFELEPAYSMPLADGVYFSAGLPITYTLNPAPTYSDYTEPAPGAWAAGFEAGYPGLFKSGYKLAVNPGIGIFVTTTPLPLEFKINYSLPVTGSNTKAAHTLSLQFRAYFALPGADI